MDNVETILNVNEKQLVEKLLLQALGKIVVDMRECSEDIAEKLELTRDIEESFFRKEEGS